MSANISIQKGIAEVFVAGQAAWHKLGVNVRKAQSWKQAIKLAHLDWGIDKKQLFSPWQSPVDAWGLFRDDNKTFLSVVGPQYTPIQNEYAFDFVDTLVEAENGAHYVTAGALGNGETIWCLAQIPDSLRIKGTDDKSNAYLLFVDYREQGKSAIAKLATERVVCWNTLQIALSDGEKFLRIRHGRDSKEKLEMAKKLLAGTHKEIRTLNDKLNELAKRKMTKESMSAILEKLFPKINESTVQQNKARDLLVKYDFNDGNAFPSERGTALNLLNATTDYIDHDRTVRVVGDKEEVTLVQREEKRAESALFGIGDQVKANTLNWILEMTEQNPRKSEAVSVDMKSARVNKILDSVAS
jgi:phage/plasmid-like protein (TIGR03299 family)